MKKLILLFFGLTYYFQITGQVAPLLNTTWNQTCYYNANCPTISGGYCGKALTGCNATAIAQIFKYYNYPATGMGSHCNSSAPTYCVDYSTENYNFASMPNNVTSANAEVAKLMYDIGVAVDMTWSATNSTSYFNESAMKRYFKYSAKMYATATFMFSTTADLIAGIKKELDEGRPVYAKGGNHFYIIDGYNLSDQFHMNFGWSGTHNGYYSISSVVNGAGTFTPSNFIFNIKPIDGDLETSKDTIVLTAGASTMQAFEFSSLLNWTASTNVSWINLNLSSGVAGYYAYSDGNYFSTSINNNSTVRYGEIYIQNANDIDTIIVKQEASPLIVNPENLNFTKSGGSENVSVSYYTWSTWTASSPDAWISVSPLSGPGETTFTLSCSNNPDSTPRNGSVIVTAGTFSNTISVYQEANIGTGIENLESENSVIYPNPSKGIVHIRLNDNIDTHTICVYNYIGNMIHHYTISNTNNYELNLTTLPKGLYTIRVDRQIFKIILN